MLLSSKFLIFLWAGDKKSILNAWMYHRYDKLYPENSLSSLSLFFTELSNFNECKFLTHFLFTLSYLTFLSIDAQGFHPDEAQGSQSSFPLLTSGKIDGAASELDPDGSFIIIFLHP